MTEATCHKAMVTYKDQLEWAGQMNKMSGSDGMVTSIAKEKWRERQRHTIGG